MTTYAHVRNPVGVMVALTLLLLTAGCGNKEEMKAEKADIISEVSALRETHDLLLLVEDIVRYATTSRLSSTSGLNAPCVVTTQPAPGAEIKVDYGAGCLCQDGRTRRGVVEVSYQGHLNQTGFRAAVRMQNFAADGTEMTGTWRLGRPRSDQFALTSQDMRFANGSGAPTEWSADLTRTRTQGATTPFDFNDDVFVYGGSTTATSNRGVAYVQRITASRPLEFISSCEPAGKLVPVRGESSFVSTGHTTRVVDFGNGTCDRVASMSISERRYDVTF